MAATSSCFIDNEAEDKKNEEDAKLKQYLTNHSITENPVNGIYFVRRDTVSGVKPVSSDYVLVNYNLRLVSNSLIETNNFTLASKYYLKPSVITKGPMLISINNSLPGIREGLKLLNEGDSALFVIPNDMALGSFYTDVIPSYSSLLYEVRLVKIIKDPITYDKAFLEKWVQDSLKLTLADSTSNGNYMVISEQGLANDSITSGKTVSLRYIGRYSDGRYLSNKNTFDTITFKTGKEAVIEGFEDVVSHLQNKAKAKCVIPYYNAYGAEGFSNSSTGQILIPLYTSLYYEIEILTVN